MSQSSLPSDEDPDSLFGSPPPSPVRGRSPPQETLTAAGPVIAVPSTGAGRKNVGTIALPGSHMSCAELPADLPATGLSLSCRTSSLIFPSMSPPTIPNMPTPAHTPVVPSRPSTHLARSSESSAPTIVRSTSARRRRTPKAKSLTPAAPAPPITLPGPDEPTPSNFLRSQSSLLGLAGLVGCVKPAQLHAHGSRPSSIPPSRSHSPVRGMTPTHPIILDDDQDTPHIGKHPRGRHRMPERLDQLDPEVLRSNIMGALTKEKNIFPVLESLIKIFGGEPHLPLPHHPLRSFARPYGHGIFNPRSPSSVPPSPASDSSTSVAAAPPPKRRKLKHVPAGAADWDVPFPFATGEGPEAYHDTWPQDRAKQLVTQLLELVQSATKRAAIKTAKRTGKTYDSRIRAQSHRSSRSMSVETQPEQISSTPTNALRSSFRTAASPAGIPTEMFLNMTSMNDLGRCLGPSGVPNTDGLLVPGPEDGISVDSEVAVEEGGSSALNSHSAFEEWLSQLQQFMPLETNAPIPELEWSTRESVSFNSSSSSPAPNILAPTQSEALAALSTIRDEAIDPALLAISQQTGASELESSMFPTSTLTPGNMVQVLDSYSTPPVLTHSPRTSSSSFTEPPTPPETCADIPTSTTFHQELVRGLFTRQSVEIDCHSQPVSRVQARTLSPSPLESEFRCTLAAQKGKRQTGDSVASAAPIASTRSTSSITSSLVLHKHAILDRARERRRQLVVEIERAKTEVWEMSIENAVLVHLAKCWSS